MGVFYFFFQFLAVLIRILTKYGHGSLEFTCLYLLKIHAVLIQQSMKVRYLCQHTDRTDYSEGSRDYSIGYTGHKISATRGNLVDRHRQWNLSIFNTQQLRGRETVFMDQATGILEAYQDFVLSCCHGEYGGNFLAQRCNRARLDISTKIQNKDTFPAVRLLFGFLLCLLASLLRFGFPFIVLSGQHTSFQRQCH